MSCVTFHYDNARTGLLQRPARIDDKASAGGAWGKYRELDLGSPVRGAVLFLDDWHIREGNHTGETHTMLYVATSANEVFAFSEEQLRAGPAGPIWQTALGVPSERGGSNIPPPVGVCSTMVLDPDQRRLFVAALTDDGRGAGVYRIYALSLDTGWVLSDSLLSDPGEPGRPTFIGNDHDQRSALTLVGGRVFIPFADFLANDDGPYRGWIVGCHADDLKQQIYFPVTRSVNGGGIWGPGGAAVGDDSLYIVTGNAPTAESGRPSGMAFWSGLGPSSRPGDIGDFFEAVVRLDAAQTMLVDGWTAPIQVPGWFGAEDQGGGVAVSDLNGDGKPELVVFHIDNPSGENHGYYRVGSDVDAAGNVAGGWTAPIEVPGWFGAENQGGGVAVADLNGNGKPDLVVFHIDHPGGGNHGYYRIGWDLDGAGNVTGGWTAPIQVPGWFGAENQGGGVAVADLNGNGKPDLVVFHIDNPSGENRGHYRIGWDVDAAGNVTGGWTAPIPVPGWFGAENQAGSIAVADLNGNGKPDLVVFHIDHPGGGNHGYYRIGWDVDAAGNVTGGWTAPIPVPGWFGDENQGGGIAVADLNGNGKPDLVVFHVDNPSGENHGYFRIGVDLERAESFTVQDWYLPTNARDLNDADNDLGGSSALVLPNVNGGDGLLVTSGKDGDVYLLDRNQMGRWGGEAWRAHIFHGEARCAPAYYRSPAGEHCVFFSGKGNPGLVAFKVVMNGGQASLVEAWRATDASGPIGLGDAAGSPIVVSTQPRRGSQEYATVWIVDGGDATPTLRAFSAADGLEVYSSSGSAADSLGAVPHYPPINCSARSVFVGTNSGVACYRLPWRGPSTSQQIGVFHIDNPSGENHGYYRFGWDLDAAGNVAGGWTPPIQVPGWFGAEDQGGGIASADLNGNGTPDLVVFHIDNPSGENHGYYRIGWDVDVFGQVRDWTKPIPVPGWFGAEDQGGGIAVADLNGNGKPDLVVFHIDHPSGGNHGYYRIGWNVDAAGNVAGGWSAPIEVPGWFGAENQGGGIAVADLNANGKPDLVVFHIDHPSGGNHGYYRIGWDVDAAGNVTGGWTAPIPVPGWFGAENQAGSIAVADLNGNGKADLVVFHIDHPSGGNHGYYRIGRDVDPAGNVTGGWTAPIPVPGSFGDENQGGGIALVPLASSWVWR